MNKELNRLLIMSWNVLGETRVYQNIAHDYSSQFLGDTRMPKSSTVFDRRPTFSLPIKLLDFYSWTKKSLLGLNLQKKSAP